MADDEKASPPSSSTNDDSKDMRSCSFLPQLKILDDDRLTVALSHCPVTKGHALAVLKDTSRGVFSLPAQDLVQIMDEIRKIANLLRQFYKAERCALVTTGDDTIGLLPLHVLTEDGKSITSVSKEFHDRYPGYVSSKNGPEMKADRLDLICAQIRGVSKIEEPFNYAFSGNQTDENQFARIVRGELPQHRIWEDEHHVAFLTPFANTPGLSVLVPRAHLPGDVFSYEYDSFVSYDKLVGAAHHVANLLIQAFGVSRCGMIFEAVEIDYAHVKLIPIHEACKGEGNAEADAPKEATAEYHETYQGSVTSQRGPVMEDLMSLEIHARSMYRALSL